MAEEWNEDVGAKEVDAYIASAPVDAQPSLGEMRRILRSALPEAVEVISYGIPAYKQKRMIVAFGAARKHCGLYAMSPAVLEALKDELAPYSTSKGTVRFPLGQPLPEPLIRQIAAMRLAENLAST